MIDPAVFTIRNGSFGVGPDFIGEKKLEKILQNGVNFSASAANQIVMQDLSDNVLQGGRQPEPDGRQCRRLQGHQRPRSLPAPALSR